MGVGEPLLNLKLIEEVYLKEEFIKERLGYKYVGYAIATMMPNKNIVKLKELVTRLEIPLKVHFSMHTPIDEDRFKLIPSTKVNVKEALEYLEDYKNTLSSNGRLMEKFIKLHTTDNLVEIHYTLIKGVNDNEKELNEVCNLFSKYNITIKFIRFNPISMLEISENESLWLNTLKERLPNLRTKSYSPPGREIGSSCGEFTKHYYHEEIETEEERIEFENWKEKHQIFE